MPQGMLLFQAQGEKTQTKHHKAVNKSNLMVNRTKGILIPKVGQDPHGDTDYSTTPGGTIFGTTPGGTKIVYERAFLVNMRNSPLSQTPPANMPNIPGITTDFGKKEEKMENHVDQQNSHKDEVNGDDQFSMDI